MNKSIIKKNIWTKEQIALIARTVARGASMDELGLFFNIAKRAGLDPFTKQIHLVPRKVKQTDGSYKTERTVQVGIDGYRAIAERTKELAGIEDVIFDDGFKYEIGKEPKNPSKATITIYRMVSGQRVPFTATARWREYFPGEKMGFMWNRMPYLMLGKVAEALALRKAFPNDLSGLYIEEEMEKEDIIAGKEEIKTEKKELKGQKEIKKAISSSKYYCQNCDIELTKAVAEYSKNLYGILLCREDQKGAKKLTK